MSKKKHKKSDKNYPTQKLVLITTILNLITALLILLEHML